MTFTVTFSDPTLIDIAALKTFADGLAQTSAGAPTTAAVIDYFPADAASAPFPSPENSQIVIAGAPPEPGPNPYLKASDGSIHTLAVAGGLGIYSVNGTVEAAAGGVGIAQLLVRQGFVYVQVSSGQWALFSTGTGALEPASLPPAFSTSATASSPALPALPPAPAPSTIAPGSSGNVILAGPSQPAVKTIAAAIASAAAGDTIRLDAKAIFKEAPPAWSVPLLIDGQGATIDVDGLTGRLAAGLGALVPQADSIIQNITVINAGMDKTSADGTAGIRPGAACILTLNNVNAANCQNGLFAGGFATDITVNGGTFQACGLALTVDPNGASHNIYVSNGGSYRLTLNNHTSINPVAGHAVKCRAPILVVSGGTFSAGDATVIDIPDGSTLPFAISNAVIDKGAADVNHGVISYAVESQTNGLAGGAISGGAINALCASPLLETQGGTITLTGVARTGNAVIATGGGTAIGL